MFLYEVSTETIRLEKAFLFAEKDPKEMDQIMAKRLALPPLNKREFVEPEIPGFHYGEYDTEDPHCDGYYNSYLSYDAYIDFKENDEVLLEKLKKDKIKEREDEKKKREAEARKLTKSGTLR